MSFSVTEIIGAASLATWIYLLFGRGGFWRVREQPAPASSGISKPVAVVIPARNEEAFIGQAVASLLHQDYPGHIHIFVVDDHSSDATASAAGVHERLTVVQAGPLPKGWTGKLWAISEGLRHALALSPGFILLTDADIVHAPDNVAGLATRAEAGNLDLTSYMVKLRCQTFPERALIPAFVYFFFQLYPPSWSMSAAGGCILVRPDALARIGGIESIRGELIDDCALARAIRKDGNIWIGVTQTTRSIRDYNAFAEIRRMISRTAFTQLRHSTLLLVATMLGMLVVYAAPALLIFSDRPGAVCGFLAWAAMTISYVPTLRFYGRSMAWAPLLPLIALFYIFATVDSAVRYWTGRGGMWKDRIQNIPSV
ncbi:MAG TPA: glycosyltransferase [Bryobacteraceae bacterium]